MISVLCPTRGRPNSITRLLSSAVATADGPIELVFYADDDDRPTGRVLRSLVRSRRHPGLVKAVTGPRIVLSDMWNRCYEAAAGEILMHCGDDIIFRTRGWDTRVVEAVGCYPDRIVLVYGDDGLQHEAIATHSFRHRAWIEAAGYFLPPYFASDFADLWLTDVARKLGRLHYLPEVYTEHLHPGAGKANYDLTHRERLDRHERDHPDLIYAAKAAEREAEADRLRAVMW